MVCKGKIITTFAPIVAAAFYPGHLHALNIHLMACRCNAGHQQEHTGEEEHSEFHLASDQPETVRYFSLSLKMNHLNKRTIELRAHGIGLLRMNLYKLRSIRLSQEGRGDLLGEP